MKGWWFVFPVIVGDFYVDAKDSTNEWIVMDSCRRGAALVTLPEECSAQPDPTATTVAPTG